MVLKIRSGQGTYAALATMMERQGTGPLSPFGEETLKADAKAFAALMRHIKEVDPQHTVIMMQVENEAGSLGDSRDQSSLAEVVWAKSVPAALMNYLNQHKADLVSEMKEVWGRNGYKSGGTWPEVFGTDEWSDEIFMAYHVGRFMGEVASAGKAELNIPMYANAWLGPQPGQDLPGKYPSGGPVSRVTDVYRAAAPSFDLLAPDIYVADFKGTCDLYARSGKPVVHPRSPRSGGQSVLGSWPSCRAGLVAVWRRGPEPRRPSLSSLSNAGGNAPAIRRLAGGGQSLGDSHGRGRDRATGLIGRL
jgi:hypothetical protein